MKCEIRGTEMIITVPINSNPPASSTGKSLMVYSTSGFVKPAGIMVNGKPVSISMNVCIPVKAVKLTGIPHEVPTETPLR